MFNEYGPGTLSDFLDVQGLSHGIASEYQSVRVKQPTKPLIASECCSCLTQRDENDAVFNTKYRSFNADCLQAEVGLTDALPVNVLALSPLFLGLLCLFLLEFATFFSVCSRDDGVDTGRLPGRAGSHKLAASERKLRLV